MTRDLLPLVLAGCDDADAAQVAADAVLEAGWYDVRAHDIIRTSGALLVCAGAFAMYQRNRWPFDTYASGLPVAFCRAVAAVMLFSEWQTTPWECTRWWLDAWDGRVVTRGRDRDRYQRGRLSEVMYEPPARFAGRADEARPIPESLRLTPKGEG